MDHQIEKYMKNPLFENIAADHLQAMLGCLHSYTRNYKKGEVIIMEKDSIPLFRGFQVSFDLVGAARLMFGDRGEIGGGLRINLHDQWFPVVEFGIGKANHDNDEATYITYKTTAPYFRVGIDINLLKNKHQSNRLYGGIRYGFTSYKVDITRMDLEDPIWGTKSDIVVEGMKCSMHWFEVVFGIDAKIFGPLHLGWDVRYKRRLSLHHRLSGRP